jgi:hypothetical protein
MRAELVASWRSDPSRLWTVLSDLAQDERILGACACSTGGMTLARTDDYPDELPCERLVARVQREGADPQWGHWTSVETLPGGDVHLSALPVSDGTDELGYVMLVHDLAFVGRREARTRVFIAGPLRSWRCWPGVTLIASRMSWRDWARSSRILRGVEKKPVPADPVGRASSSTGSSTRRGRLTPQRLKDTLRHVCAEKVVVP